MTQVEFAPVSTFLEAQGVVDEENYVRWLVRVSLLLRSRDFPLEVQHHGNKILQHLLEFRREELTSTDLLNLTVELVMCPNKDHTSSQSANPRKQNKHRRSLLVLAANNNLRSLDEEGIGGVQSDNEGAVDINTSSESMSSPLMPFLSLIGQRPLALGQGRTDLSIALDPLPLSRPASLAAPVIISCLDRSSIPCSYNFLSSESVSCLETDGSIHSSSSNKSNSSSVTCNGSSGESSNNNLTCLGSFELSCDLRMDCDESELEVQRLMAIDISDDNVVDGPEGQDHFANIVPPQMLRFSGKAYCHQLKGCLLLAEHNILCQAFIMISCSRNIALTPDDTLLFILDLLNVIWTQPEWEDTFLHTGLGLSCLFSDYYFLKTVCWVVTFCEDYLTKGILAEEITVKQSYETPYSFSLLRLILPLLLRLLRYIHNLWKDQIACNLSEELESAKMLMTGEEGFKLNVTSELLEGIRESGYEVIGLCMSLGGSFDDLLDKSSFCVAFMDLETMEFRHLSKLIDAVFIPLVRNCPIELWKGWMLDLLRPLLRHCESVLYAAWFSLMHKGRAKVPYYFGKLTESVEDVEELERSQLLEFTRAVCHLFENLSRSESNSGIFYECFEDASDSRITAFKDLESVSSSSLIGYLLVHDCFGRLRMSLFGYWADDEASKNAVPFCRALVWLAGVTKDQRLELFVLDELLPSLIQRLDDQLPCAIRRLICKLNPDPDISGSVNEDLIVLCREAYDYLSSNVHAECQNIEGGDKGIGNAADNFMCWLAQQKIDLRARAHLAVPNEFDKQKTEWNWEFEDEFRTYLPIYIDMLKEVDAILGSSKVDYSDWEFLEKLNLEFRSKHAINSIEHHHFITISNMRRRKYYSMAQVRNHKEMAVFLRQIITLKPYIKGSDSFSSVINRLENIVTPFSRFYSFAVEESVHVLLDSVLYFWEPRFHPLIREENEEFLLWVVEQLTMAKEFDDFEPLTPDPRDFPTHLKPYAILYILTKLKTSEYATAEVQLRLHQEYDDYLASGENLFGVDVESFAVPQKFSNLDPGLIKLSLKRRDAILKIYNEVQVYSDCIRGLIADDSRRSRLTSLMREFEIEDFFSIDKDVNWKKTTELVDRFNDEVFNGRYLPRHYVIRGIIDCRTILVQKDMGRAFKQVVGDKHDRLRKYLPKFWRDTRYYKQLVGFISLALPSDLRGATGAILPYFLMSWHSIYLYLMFSLLLKAHQIWNFRLYSTNGYSMP